MLIKRDQFSNHPDKEKQVTMVMQQQLLRQRSKRVDANVVRSEANGDNLTVSVNTEPPASRRRSKVGASFMMRSLVIVMVVLVGDEWRSVWREKGSDALPAVRRPNDVRRAAVQQRQRHLAATEKKKKTRQTSLRRVIKTADVSQNRTSPLLHFNADL